ncbi:MAG: hypothetical protein J6Y60_05650 [Treponema sp.]|nr:hypothetical protein [Treponema sp.]
MKKLTKSAICTILSLASIFILSCKKTPTAGQEPESQADAQASEEIPSEPEAAPEPEKYLDSQISTLVCSSTGMEELGFGHYDPRTGIYHSCIEENGPYITALSYLNTLYRTNLLAPDMQKTFSPTNDETPEKIEKQIARVIEEDSWKAIQADSQKEFDRLIKQLQIDAKTYGIDAQDALSMKQASQIKEGN